MCLSTWNYTAQYQWTLPLSLAQFHQPSGLCVQGDVAGAALTPKGFVGHDLGGRAVGPKPRLFIFDEVYSQQHRQLHESTHEES